jgi:hypothetical protein
VRALGRSIQFTATGTLVLASLAGLHPPAASAERLVYSVHSNTLIPRSASGGLQWKASTTVHAWDSRTGKTSAVFSDGELDLALLVRYGSGQYQE